MLRIMLKVYKNQGEVADVNRGKCFQRMTPRDPDMLFLGAAMSGEAPFTSFSLSRSAAISIRGGNRLYLSYRRRKAPH